MSVRTSVGVLEELQEEEAWRMEWVVGMRKRFEQGSLRAQEAKARDFQTLRF
jgi:hypothetical protein